MTIAKLIALAFASALVALSMFGVYYTHQLPTEEQFTITLLSYGHTGEYDYTAYLKPNIIYNTTTLKPGEETLYTRIIKYINVTFTYIFECSRPAEGTIEYHIITALETPRWNKTLTTIPWNAINLTGTTQEFTISHIINPTAYEQIINAIDKETGTTTSEYSLTINHHIHTQAKTDVGTIDEHFTPTLKITFKPRSQEGDIITIDDLNHTSPGTITQTEKTPLPWVTYQRYASYAFSAASLSALLYTIWTFTKTKLKPEKPEKSIEEIIEPYEEIIMEAAAEPTYEKERTTIRMKTLEDLVGVADGLAKPVLYLKKPPTVLGEKPTHVFYMLDGLIKYEYETTAPSRTEVETKTTIEEESEND